MTNYFNAITVFECGRNILYRLDVPYERACIETSKEEYFMEVLDRLIKHNHRHVTPISNEKLQEVVIRVIEDEEKDAKRNDNNVTTDTLFRSPGLSMHKRKIQT